MKEIWKDIDEFPNYEVSSFGRVRNKKYNRFLKPLEVGFGYVVVELWNNGQSQSKKIHRLVANAFIPNPHNKPQVNHIDGNKKNNSVDNLEWVTASENMKHAYDSGIKKVYHNRTIRIIETGEIFDSIKECAKKINGYECDIIRCLQKNNYTHKGYHFEYVNEKTNKHAFLYPFQMDAVKRMFNGCILAGGVGSGKSRSGLFYYFKEQGGWIDENGYKPMNINPKDLYIITTAKKRNSLEWQGELCPFLLSADEKQTKRYGNKIIIDSWNNVQKYKDVTGAFFIFDEDRVTGNGAWVKAFLKIAKHNDWIILSATPGDTYSDYIPVFIANGFYKNRTEFAREHIVYARFSKYPKIERYINTGRLNAYRNKLLIDMDFKRETVRHNEDVYVNYNTGKHRDATRTRWNPYKNEPMKQASDLCYVLRRIVNEDVSRQVALLELYEKHPKMIVFYNFDYELDILLNLAYGNDVKIAQYNGHVHDPLPNCDKWVYLVQYTAGAEGWNAITTDTIVFYSQTYSYKTLEQARGRIDRLNTPFTDLYYYHLKSRSGIDLAISKALSTKKNFNESRWAKW